MELRGKTALVTGGHRRLGKAMATGLAAGGANVIVAHHQDEELAQAAVDEIRACGVQAMRLQFDVSDAAAVQTAVEEAGRSFPPVDILVNSASVYKKVPFPHSDTANWDASIGVILNGAFYLSNALAPAMLHKGEGAIINVCDLSVWEAWPAFGGHAVAKAGLWALTRQLALELAPSIRVNAVAPGPIIPPVGYSEERIRRVSDSTLLNGWGDPQDIVRTLRYIIETDYLTGTIIPVDGGQRFGHRKYEEA